MPNSSNNKTSITSWSPVKTVQNQSIAVNSGSFDHQGQGIMFPVVEVENNGVPMGVLSDGTPFLHLRGLAALCGVDHANIQRLASNWAEEKEKPRGKRIQELLDAQGYRGTELHFRTLGKSGELVGFQDAVCMAVLEYYAFDAKQSNSQVAIQNYRLLARSSLRLFIYKGCGYNPESHLAAGWKQFHDRVSLTYNAVPHGYFGVFKEISDLIVRLGQSGMHIDHEFVPDISVGLTWAKHWNTMGLSKQFGERAKYQHNYPDYFPQAASNPQEPWCYPDAALGEFRRWVRENYIGAGKFESYMRTKVDDKSKLLSLNQSVAKAYLQ